jgi:hypothetical protein
MFSPAPHPISHYPKHRFKKDGRWNGKYGKDADGKTTGAFKLRNSWGRKWADNGY